MILYNMTGGTIRNDPKGGGYWRSSRGAKLHKGIDLTIPGGVGSAVRSPITGVLERVAYPYADDTRFEGAVFVNGDIMVKAFYFYPAQNLIQQKVTMGEVCGIAQDISIKYVGMTPHIHIQVDRINPLILM